MCNGQEAAKTNKGSMWERGKEKRNNGERPPQWIKPRRLHEQRRMGVSKYSMTHEHVQQGEKGVK